jgi:hypothetical protein
MAKRLTINERNILVDQIYSKVTKSALDKISEDMQTNPDYQAIILASQTIVDLRKELGDLTQTREDAIKEFNKSFGHEYFELKQPYSYSDEKHPRFAPNGLKSAIEADVVVANIGDSVDFQTLLKQMEEKYA